LTEIGHEIINVVFETFGGHDSSRTTYNMSWQRCSRVEVIVSPKEICNELPII